MNVDLDLNDLLEEPKTKQGKVEREIEVFSSDQSSDE